MDRPPPDPQKLLSFWMEWEKGDATPGTLMKNLKNGGMRDILEEMASAAADTATPSGDAPSDTGS